MKEDLYTLYEKLDKYFNFERINSIFTTILKSIILLACGGLFGYVLREYFGSGNIKILALLIFILLLITYIFLESIRLSKERNFPIGILQHLKAIEELQETKKKIDRHNKVFEFIDNSIRSLNSNTCPIAFGEPSNQLCHQNLSDGLKGVLNDLVERTNYFFDVDKSKFTIGVYLENIMVKNNSDIVEASKNFIFKDDLNLEDSLPIDSTHFNSENDLQFKILTKFLESINFSRYLEENINAENRNLLIVCSPIPNVCESCPPIGVIYAIYEGCDKCSTDSENVMLINGRLLSNWISKYEDCLYKTYSTKNETQEPHSHNQIIVPKEVQELIEKKRVKSDEN
ncbi:hypothetical protein [Halpernia frigidisoli]|uniref:Uncharacterized protein n=1 Tax=Halpernia frigidisoli TaxID=1125876 RepID=A0A1I3GFE5_9FLAO|nr:hypothetical protein [Halpernia frigidisoli]SFI21901.1 hypothetical protein SAMN05443292_1805 [Halpernia frigidisoli]